MMIAHNRAFGLAFGLALLTTPAAFGAVAFDWATIGNAGNAADPTTGFGTVGYEYRMATTEVTNAQYAEFLNAVAATDNFGGPDPNLYNINMDQEPTAGIIRSGSAGSYTYAIIPGRENNPVVNTSFIDAMRFTNWMENGQGSGGTETGVYNVTDGSIETRAAGAGYFLPSEDEWYKAAYYQPASEGGDSDNYWLYPTSTNSVPIAGVDANFGTGGGLMPVGSYSANFFGLFDMGGNVLEWTEGFFYEPLVPARVIRGGGWENNEFGLRSSSRFGDFLGTSDSDLSVGFRIASAIPTPGPVALMAGAAPMLLRRRRT